VARFPQHDIKQQQQQQAAFQSQTPIGNQNYIFYIKIFIIIWGS
jgi:hypothetical protein